MNRKYTGKATWTADVESEFAVDKRCGFAHDTPLHPHEMQLDVIGQTKVLYFQQ